MQTGVDHGGSFNTIGQSRTYCPNLPSVEISGEGSKPDSYAKLQKRTGKKFLTQKLMNGLIEIAEKLKNESLRRSFWNTYNCQKTIITHGGRAYSKYCKNRYCLVCLGIRKAELINKYYPVLKNWEDPKFVTLTIRSVTAKKLPMIMKNMNRAFRMIIDRNRQRYKRGKGIKLMGIRSLECNFNPERSTYNPHFHIIVPNMLVAKQLKADWLDLWTKKYNEHWAQKIVDVNDLETSLVEIIKYSTKVFTEPNPNSKTKTTASRRIYLRAMYNIIAAMKGERVFERFGFNLPKKSDEQTSTTRLVTDYDIWKYIPEHTDWYSELTGQCLSKYSPEAKIQNMIDNYIDTESQ